jgi:hypothetical protein
MTEARTAGTLSLPSYLIDEYILISKSQRSLVVIACLHTSDEHNAVFAVFQSTFPLRALALLPNWLCSAHTKVYV